MKDWHANLTGMLHSVIILKSHTYRTLCNSVLCNTSFFHQILTTSGSSETVTFETNLKFVSAIFHFFLKDKCISSLFRTNYIQKKFNWQLLFLPTVSRTFILSRATTRYPPPWNFLFRKNNCMCNRGNARDVAACPNE